MPSTKKLVKQRSGKFAICQELTVELQPVATRAGAQLIRHGSGISAALKYARPRQATQIYVMIGRQVMLSYFVVPKS
jgi:hypothetical protein